MRSIFRLAILAAFALLATQGWAFLRRLRHHPTARGPRGSYPRQLATRSSIPLQRGCNTRSLKSTRRTIRRAGNRILLIRTRATIRLTSNFIAKFGAPERYAYGPSQYEGLDLYRSMGPPGHAKHAPTMIFIHGGAWRGGSASGYGYFAENFVEAGANLVVLDFINVTQTVGC